MSRGNKSLRWVSWAAVSSAPQAKKISLQDQLDTNRVHIERHGGELVEELVVPGVSRSIVLFEDACHTIEAYARLRELIANRSFDVLVYLDRSRLGRKASLSMAIVELCHDAGIVTYETDSPPIELTKPGHDLDALLLGAIKSTMAQNEVIKINQRNRMGMAARIRQGLHPSTPPYGYHYVYTSDGERHVEPDPTQAPGVKMLFREYVTSGRGLVEIGKLMVAAGYSPPRSRQWAIGSLTRILTNVWQYAGRVVYRRKNAPVQMAPAQWEPLIDDDMAHAVIAERKRRAPTHRAVNTTVRFSQMAVCDKCGAHLSLNNKSDMRYACAYKCRGSTIAEWRLYSAIEQAIDHLAAQGDLSAIANSDPGEHVYERQQLAQYQKRLDAIARQRERLTVAYTREVLGLDEYERVMSELSAEREQLAQTVAELEAMLAAEPDPAERQGRLEDIVRRGYDMLKNDNVLEANAWLRTHFRLYVWKNRVSGVQYL